MAETKGRIMPVTFTGSYQALRAVYPDLSWRRQLLSRPDESAKAFGRHCSEAGVPHEPSA